MRSVRKLVASPSLSFVLLVALLLIGWVSGGASRPDVLGQVLTRTTAVVLLVIAILFGSQPRTRGIGAPAIILLLALLLALVQLIPLPPEIWQRLSGRSLLADAARVSGQPQPWRPWSIVPSRTINAASSLIVPVATWVIAAGLAASEQRRVLGLLICVIALSAFVGLLQFSGAQIQNPLVNGTPGEVDGLFANRNHFALFVAIGCLLVPAWAFQGRGSSIWRSFLALGLLLLFVLIILASGSRAGIILGSIAMATGLSLAWKPIRARLSTYPRWVFFAAIAGSAALVAGMALVSVVAGRAVSVDRAMMMNTDQDIRNLARPTVWRMIAENMPWGSGLGGFDLMFRVHEPFALLQLTYFNHAHNEFLEIPLDAGIPGTLLLIAAILWWARASLFAWRQADQDGGILPKLGSGVLFLILIASIFDYPARTPIIMALTMIAALWLAQDGRRSASALPRGEQHL